MEFRNQAAREASALISRLAASMSEKSSRDLQAVRHALDMVAGAVDSVLQNTSTPTPDLNAEVTALADRLTEHATAFAEAVGDEVGSKAQEMLDGLRAELQARSADNDKLKAMLAEATSKLQAAEEEAAKIISQHKDEANRIEKLTAAVDAKTKELQAADTQRKTLSGQLKAAVSDLEAMKRASNDKERAFRTLNTKLEAATSATTNLKHRAETAEREVKRVRAEAELAAQGSVRAARAVQEAEAQAARKLVEQADVIRQHATGFLSASLDRLVAMYLSVASGATVDTVLTAMVEAMAVHFSRVALFRVQANHLEGVRQVGFDLRADISQLLIPRTLDALVNHAVASAQIETLSSPELAKGGTPTPFGGSPDFALALPVVIDGQPFAVLYADDSDQPHRDFAQADLRQKYAQLLHCHAVPLLSRLTAEARAFAELDEYAKLLIDELEHTYAAELESQASDVERQQRLRDNVEYARQLYAQRAASEGSRAASLLEQHLMAAAESRGNTVFGRDLAALVGHSSGAEGADAAASAN